MKGKALFLGLVLMATLLPGLSVSAAEDDSVIPLAELQENLDVLFPNEAYLTGLAYHSEWNEIDRGTMTETSGIEVTYEAAFDLIPEQDDELPHINAYILPMSSRSAAEAQFNAWLNSSNFSDGTWVLKASGSDYFSYYTSSYTENDVIKDRTLEEGSLHMISYYNNVLIVGNFYRTSGSYLRSNVSAYLTYLENDEETLSILSELVVYVEEALKFYTGTSFSIDGPGSYEYHLTSASDSVDLSSTLMAMPLHGRLSFDLYIDDGSEIGTIVDMVGSSTPVRGAFTLSLNEKAQIELAFYDPQTTSSCGDERGWHRLVSDSLNLYEWQSVELTYGKEDGLALAINGETPSQCALSTARVNTAVYLGDFPDDGVSESFVGYLNNVSSTYAVDANGLRYDDQEAEHIFADVVEGDPYADAIAYLRDEGIIEGYTDGTFRPDAEVNRVEILKMLLLGFDYSVPATSTLPASFPDLTADAWYLPYVNLALSLQVVEGYSDGTYKPANPVNRVEFLKILTRIYGLNLNDYPITGLYPDTDEDAWYAAYVQYSKDNDLMALDANGNFNPSSSVTRGEVAQAIYQLIR